MTTTELDTTSEGQSAIAALQHGAKRLVTLGAAERQRLLRACVAGIEQNWEAWVDEAWSAKRIPVGSSARAEDIMSGPLPTVRYLQLLHQSLGDIARHGQPRLPGKPFLSRGHLRVPVFPTRSLFDRLMFGPISAQVRMRPGVTPEDLYGDSLLRASGAGGDKPLVTLVLGAGNVSSIPITDALTKIFQDNQAVLLKMNPVNAYVGPIFERAFSSLIDAGFLQIVYGGADFGSQLISASGVDCIHITGSDRTHDAIVWGGGKQEQADRKMAGTPILRKPITSELGNVSPWIILPGHYTDRQLRFQAENIVASVSSNASFVCIATKMLITWKDWPQRHLFLGMIDEILAKTPRRFSYYPGAADRYARFAGATAKDDLAQDAEYLPWKFRRDLEPIIETHLFTQESFVCVFGETALAAKSPAEFLNEAVDFANERMWGTLSAALTVPPEYQQSLSDDLVSATDRLRYGTIGINQWPGVAFALMSTPWGAYPGATLEDIQSGLGSVHNTFLLDQPQQSVLASPLTIFPKPMWFSTHGCPEAVARNLLKLYFDPKIWRIPPILAAAVRG